MRKDVCGMVASIAAASAAQSQARLRADVSTALLGKMMDNEKESAAALMKILQVQPAAGRMDIRA